MSLPEKSNYLGHMVTVRKRNLKKEELREKIKRILLIHQKIQGCSVI